MRSKFNIIYLYLLIFFRINICFADTAAPLIDDSIREYLRTNKIYSTYYVATDANEVIAQGASGYFSCSSKQKELKVDSLMPIASITKSMTASAIMRLHEKSKIQLHDTVDQYIPKDYWPNNTPPSWSNQITIHQLLTHSAGLPDYIWHIACTDSMTENEIKKHVLQVIASQNLLFTPGHGYHYSNSGYFILGLIIEFINEKSLPNVFKDEFFVPLGMNNTYLLSFHDGFKAQMKRNNSPFPEGCIAVLDKKRSSKKGGELILVKAPLVKLMPPFADGGVMSNVLDLYKWNVALHNGKVVSNESYTRMVTPHVKVTKQNNKMLTNTHYGYGLNIALLPNGEKIYGHSGNFYTVRGEQWYIPSKSISISILGNIFVPRWSSYNAKVNAKIKENVDIKSLLNFSISQLLAK